MRHVYKVCLRALLYVLLCSVHTVKSTSIVLLFIQCHVATPGSDRVLALIALCFLNILRIALLQ